MLSWNDSVMLQCGRKTFAIGRKGFLGKTKKKPLTIPNLVGVAMQIYVDTFI